MTSPHYKVTLSQHAVTEPKQATAVKSKSDETLLFRFLCFYHTHQPSQKLVVLKMHPPLDLKISPQTLIHMGSKFLQKKSKNRRRLDGFSCRPDLTDWAKTCNLKRKDRKKIQHGSAFDIVWGKEEKWGSGLKQPELDCWICLWEKISQKQLLSSAISQLWEQVRHTSWSESWSSLNIVLSHRMH